ncbi:MAG: radical SAM family heme chaperone HemW, partial [Bacteroidales bacterium]|nr:radical SAM family heme chaperone HemW [Bacteroidales bacterium]
MKNKDFGVYVHIPFCDSKCSYCSFVSGAYDNEVKNSYFKALQKEIKSDYFLGKNSPVTSIYFGGGTPSSVDSKNIKSILNVLKKFFKVDENAEISIECNPCSVDFKKLADYKKAGFTRISFGAQSFDDEVLKSLNRRHCVAQIFDAIQIATKVGFENISIDLIIGIKKTDFLNFEQNVLKLKNMGLKHISVYMLMLESGTKLFTAYQNNAFKPLSDDECVFEYNKILKILKKLEFYRYEISNFALKNFECKHNQNYWNCGEYLGFGVASHSFINGKRIETASKIFEYINHFNELNELNKINKINELNIHKKLIEFDKS